MPFVLFIVAIRDDEMVLLEDVRGLALLAHHKDVAAARKLVEDQKLGLTESAKDLNGVVHDFQSDSSAGLVLPKIGTDVQVKLLADL